MKHFCVKRTQRKERQEGVFVMIVSDKFYKVNLFTLASLFWFPLESLLPEMHSERSSPRDPV